MNTIYELTEQHCQNLLNHLQMIHPNDTESSFEIINGRKYYKVVHHHVGFNYTNTTVHCFVDKNTGDIYKPATWNGPAKHVRYNLVTGWDKLVEDLDWHGAYLYNH